MTERTDRSQLEKLYALPAATAPARWRQWLTALKVWLSERVTVLEIYTNPPENAITRRLRVYQKALDGAKRLHRLPREEAQEVLRVTGMLLGFHRKRMP
jgi:hypothetical protein